MRRVAFAAGVVAALGLSICPAQAGNPWSFYRGCCAEWHENIRWPQPYLAQDRQAVGAPFAIMVEKGWQLQNTLGDHHFDVETQQLSRAGEMQLRWIVTQTLESRRTVFVQRGQNAAATSIRLDTVQQAIAAIVPEGPLPAVVQTNNAPPAAPADAINDVFDKASKARPNPVLPAAADTSGGSSGS